MNFRRVMFILITFFVFFLIYSVASYAQEKQPQPGTINMDFKDASLKDVLKVFSIQSGLNFVASEKVEDRAVTLYLENVSVEDALNTILKANNLIYERDPKSDIFIVKESGKPEVETITRIYTLNYAKVKEDGESNIEDILKGMLSPHGEIMVDRRTNSVIIKDVPAQFPQIEETIARLDAKTPQVMIEAEIIETTVDMAKYIGTEWGGSTGEILTLTGADRPTSFPLPHRLTKESTTPDSSNIQLGVLSTSELNMILRFMEKEGKTKYLARPRILTLNNETATIKITTEESTSLESVTIIPETGEKVTEVERMEVGTTLKVTPTINKEGFITMVLEPEVSRTKTSNIAPTTVRDPQRRSAKAKVMVRDGETVVIGGLKSTESTENYRKVPLLGDIPILGFLFRREQTTKENTDIIVFVTPHILTEDRYMITKMENIERESIPPSKTRNEEIESVLDELSGSESSQEKTSP